MSLSIWRRDDVEYARRRGDPMKRRDWFRQIARTGVAGGAVLGLADTVDALDDVNRDDTQASGDVFAERQQALGAADARASDAIMIDVPSAAWTGAMVSFRADARAIDAVRQLVVLRTGHDEAQVASLSIDRDDRRLPAVIGLPMRLERPAVIRVLVQTDTGWLRRDARVDSVGISGCGEIEASD